jgi:hypothetical protein
MKMRLLAVAVVALVALTLSVVPGNAQGAYHVDGGGTAAGATSMSQFGFGITGGSGDSVSGHFNCLMAGRSAMTEMGLSLMSVKGPVTDATITADGVTFGGVGAVVMNSTQSSKPETLSAPYSVIVTPGGAGQGTLTLMVAGFVFAETLTSGQISLH